MGIPLFMALVGQREMTVVIGALQVFVTPGMSSCMLFFLLIDLLKLYMCNQIYKYIDLLFNCVKLYLYTTVWYNIL